MPNVRAIGPAIFVLCATLARGEPRVSGRILDGATGRPLRGAAMLFREPPFGTEDRARPAVEAEVVTKDDGRFDLPLPPGELTFRVEVAAPDHARAVAGEGIASAAVLDDVRLDAGQTIEGRVLGPDGKPVTLAQISLSSDAVRPRLWVVTDSDGRFRIEGAPREGGALAVRAEGLAPSLRQGVRGGKPIELRLAKGLHVAGRVIDAKSSDPVAGVEVLARGKTTGATKSDASGAFTFDDLAPGDLVLRAQSDRYRPAEWRGRAPLPKGSAPPEIRLRAGATLVVLARSGGQPLTRARVLVREKSGDAIVSAVTDALGLARVAGLPSVPLLATARAPGFIEAETGDLVLAAGEARQITLALQRAPTIAGIAVDGKGKPLSNVRVQARSLHTTMPLRPWQWRTPRRLPAASTDAAGRFKLTDLPMEPFELAFSRDDIAQRVVRLKRLSPGEERSGVRVSLDPAGLCAGRVVDAAGIPASGVTVSLYDSKDPLELTDPNLAAVAMSCSAADGAFLVGGLPAKALVLMAGGGVYARSAPRSVAIAAGRTCSVGDVVVKEGAALAGRVTDRQGRPLAGVKIRTGKTFLVDLAHGWSDEQGGFRLEGLDAEAAMVVFAEVPGYQRAEKSGVQPGGPPITMEMVAEPRLKGRVIEKGTGTPVTAFAVARKMSGAGGGGEGGGIFFAEGGAKTFESEDGTFEIAALPGRFDLSVRAAGYVKAQLVGVEVSKDGNAKPLLIELERGHTVTGKVFDEKHAPLQGATVAIPDESMEGPGSALAYGNTLICMTDGDGAFRLEGLASGIVELEALAPERPKASKRVEVFADVDGVEISLGRGATVTGEVRRRDGAPAPNAGVSLDPGNPMESRYEVADVSGRFSFEGVEPGSYSVHAHTSTGASSRSQKIVVGPQGLAAVVLSIEGGARIDGRVSGLPPDVLPHVSVGVAAPSGWLPATVGADGRFTIDDVLPGDVRVIASTEPSFGGRSVTADLKIAEDQSVAPVEVVFPQGARLSGHVSRAGRPLSGALVIVIPKGEVEGATEASTTTAADGSYRADGLSDGLYLISILFITTVARYETNVDVRGNTEKDLEIGEGRIEGTVLESTHRDPVPLASVTLMAGQGGSTSLALSAQTDGSGAFSFEDVNDGSYSVSVQKSGFGSATKTVQVTGGSVAGGVELLLPREALLTLRIIDARLGVPPATATLATVAGEQITDLIPIHGDRGAFAVPGLAAGTMSLVLLVPGLPPVAMPRVTVPGEASVQVPGGGEVEVRLGQGSGTVKLVGGDGSAVWMPGGLVGARTSADVVAPKATLGPVAPGSYQLLFATSSGVRTFPVTVVEGQTASVTIPQ